MIRFFYDNLSNSSASWLFYLPGFALILFGLIVLLAPEILFALIAAFFFLSGLSLLGWAHSLRKGVGRKPRQTGDVWIE